MICPKALQSYGKVCRNYSSLGRIVAALCGQEVVLKPQEQAIFSIIKDDEDMMTQRINERKAKHREHMRKIRNVSNVSNVSNCEQVCAPVSNCEQVCAPVSTCEQVCAPVSKCEHMNECMTEGMTEGMNIPRSVNVPLPEGEKGEPTATERNGTVDFNSNETERLTGKALKDNAWEFVGDYKSGHEGAFYDVSYDVIGIVCTITNDWKSEKRWRQMTAELGEDIVRDEIKRFYDEIKAGEKVKNRGAAFNARLMKLLEAKEK